MLKETTYSLGREGERNGQVKYLVVDTKVYFSSITMNPSSINSAEAIMVAIAESEGIKWQEYAFNDIQTHLGYHSKKPGQFEVDGLEFYPETPVWPHITGWTRVPCPDHVLREFAELIGSSQETITSAYPGKTWSEVQQIAFQRHHDYYVRLHRQHGGQLSLDDMAQYKLAMQRERDGVVQPSPDPEANPPASST